MVLRFCGTRWIEDEGVAEVAITVWPGMVKFISYYEQLCKSKRPAKNKSYDLLVEAVKDKLVPAKFQFFKDVASILMPFLKVTVCRIHFFV